MKFDKGLVGGSTPLLLLSLLAEGDRYGYEIIRVLEERSDNTFSFQEGTLYPVLHKLENEGWVRSYMSDASGRSRRYYAITKKGLKQVEEEREKWKAFSGAVNRVIGGSEGLAMA